MSGTSTVAASVAFPVAAAAALGASFLLVTRLERLADRWHLSEAILGLVVALAADSPEISSAVTASVRGQTAIGVGVVLGSNVFNLAALLGLGAIVAGRIVLHRKVVVLEGVTALWVASVTVIVISASWRFPAFSAGTPKPFTTKSTPRFETPTPPPTTSA